MMNLHGTTKHKLNFKERLEALGFTNYGDISFWNKQLNMKRARKSGIDIWVIEDDGKHLFENKSVVKCVEYIEENLWKNN